MTELTDLGKGDFVVCQKGVFGAQIPTCNDEYFDASDALELARHISNMLKDNIQLFRTDFC
ncbi:hypothetical protein ATT74_21700 [Salmonella enterica subsp. enterica serovar Panama]|nr:hypothetical protein [Salmonella enterica subsp. enterica serovar Panama]